MTSLSASRKALHLKGYQALTRGDYSAAIDSLQQALREYGPHVGPCSDLAFAFYLSGDYGNFRLAVERLRAEFAEAGELLSVESRIRTHMALAKFCEELGRLSESSGHVDEALRILPAGHALDFQVRSQKLRLLASFGREGDLAKSYREVLDVTESRPQSLLECFHALLLAEARLFGLAACWPRLADFCARSEIQAADSRLVLVDLLEVALETGDEAAAANLLSMMEERRQLSQLDPFEVSLVSLARKHRVGADEMFRWTRTLTAMGRLRVLALAAKLRLGDDDVLRRQLALHLDSFDHMSRKMVLHKWGHEIQSSESLEIVVDRERQEILFNQRALGLRKSGQTWDLIVALAQAPQECPPERLLELLGKNASTHNQESLRISLLRLNKKLAVLLGLGWAVRFGKYRISLHPQIRLKAV